MAIHTEEVQEISAGFSKEIDEGAKNLIFDNLQRFQYMYPIKSTIREIVSNGLDSVKEKQVALKILSGAKIEDYYEQKDGDVYKDSRFDPSYYDPEWLSDQNVVEIVYTDGGEVGKDSVIIRDYGVGLGGSRLEGFFNLGYSSKRLNKFALGKFGLGAKSPLSTGVPFYTVTTRHNGKEFIFNIYAHKAESIIPQYDLEMMVENPSHTFSNGYLCYYRHTTEKNCMQIELQVKKHHKQQYIDAVTGQLLYFQNVKCYVDSGDIRQEIPVRASIMYEDDLIILSHNSPYSKPHLLLNGVNYGYIDFRELELEEKLGSIGIKVQPERVSVNPSRESLIWDETTRQVVIDKFHEVVGVAEQTINQELKETDFLKWMRVCASTNGSNSLWSRASENTVLGRLAKIVDMSKVELSYPANPRYKYRVSLMDGVRMNRVEMVSTREGSKTKKRVEYGGSWNSALSEGLPILISNTRLSNRKSKYILTHLYKQGFILISLDIVPENGEEVTVKDVTLQNRIEEAARGDKADRYEKARQKIADLHNFVLSSADKIWYEDIQVPEDFKASEEEEDVEEDVATEDAPEEVKQSAAERRKLSGTTIIHTPRIPSGRYPKDRNFEMQKVEVPVHLVDTWSNEEIFWSNQDYEPLLHTVGQITMPQEKVYRDTTSEGKIDKFQTWQAKGYKEVHNYDFQGCPWLWDDSPVRLLKVAQNNVKYYRDFKHITKFFKEIKNKTITMANALVRWNTARLIQEKMEDLEFLKGIEPLSAEKHEMYYKLRAYVTQYWRPFSVSNTLGSDDTTTGQLISHLDNVGQFQLFVKMNPDDKDAIAQLAKELFNPQPGVDIQDGRAIEMDIYEMYINLLDWAQPVKVMLNMVKPLTYGEELDGDQQEEIRHYFQYRNCPL